MDSLAKVLEIYGGWGLSAILLVTLWRMLKYIADLHKQREEKADKSIDEQRDETRETVTALVEVKNALGSFSEAMNRLSLRLERLEE